MSEPDHLESYFQGENKAFPAADLSTLRIRSTMALAAQVPFAQQKSCLVQPRQLQLPRRDSNPKRQNQNLLCYQLHHGVVCFGRLGLPSRKSISEKQLCKAGNARVYGMLTQPPRERFAEGPARLSIYSKHAWLPAFSTASFSSPIRRALSLTG